jgi:hypothetical protein
LTANGSSHPSPGPPPSKSRNVAFADVTGDVTQAAILDAVRAPRAADLDMPRIYLIVALVPPNRGD